MLSPLILILVGLALAFAGRRLLTLFVGIAGFVLGYRIGVFFIPNSAEWLQLIIGVVIGLIAAGLASRALSLVLSIAAFILVGNVGLGLVELFNISGWLWQLIAFVVGGVVGLLILRFAFDLGLVIISALAGSFLVMQGLPALLSQEPGVLTSIIGLVVLVAGFFIQYRSMQGTKAQPPATQT